MEMDEAGVPDPSGLVFSSRANAFMVMDGKKRGQAETDIIRVTPYEDRAGATRIAAMIQDPRNMAYDEQRSRLLIFQSPSNTLIEVQELPDGSLDPRSLVRHNARHFDLQDPQGLTVDPVSGHLLFLDAAGPRIIRVEPEPDGSIDGAAVSTVDLQPVGITTGTGIALDPTTGNLHILAGQELYELDQSGQIIATRDLAAIDVVDPQGLVFAPSGDLTDDPSQVSLYISEGGESRGAGSGRIIELSFIEAVTPQAATAAGTLIQTIDTSQFSPPSPDPSGLAYLPASGTLMIGDGEVNEMEQYFTGDNLFEVSLSGNLVDTLPTLPFSDEPVGLDVNPKNRHLFISDDTGQRRVYELNPGPDEKYGTSDDSVTSFLTNAFGSSDPEGLAFDPSGSGTLFIVDGVNREIYIVTPGANGLFDGVDDQVDHFDTQSLGLEDPEGLAFDPTTGHLYAVGKPNELLFELTIDGDLVRTIDISDIDPKKPAGLAIGPNSENPGELSIYLAARGVDNDSDPDENDGKIYEIALGISIGDPGITPTSTNTSTSVPSNTPTNTPTRTSTPTSSPSPTATKTNTPTNTPPTTSPSPTATNTSTATNTPTATEDPTSTDTPEVIFLPLSPSADARVEQANPTTNFGTASRLEVDSPGIQSYLRFTVSGVSGNVQSATLRLLASNGSTDGPSLYLTDNTWTETGITWNNRPAPTSGAVANAGSIASRTWVEFDLTGVVTGNGTYNFVLLPDSSDGATFYSREASAANRPQLVLGIASGSGVTPSPTATTGPSSTPTRTATTGPSSTPTRTPTNTPVSGGIVFVGAGDIADCSTVRDEQTAQLLDNIPGTVFTAGDNAYPRGTTSDFNNCYEPTWGRHKARTRPVLGDNDYDTSGASGYFTYFGAAAGDPTKGYYSYDLGGWHIIALNSECSEVGGCDPDSPQGQWLQADLAANQKACILAIHHEPLFSSNGGDDDLQDFWEPLYAAGADIVISGHRHNYERFARQNPSGAADPELGIRQFVVGTGGAKLSSFNGGPAPNSEVRNDSTHGVLKLTLFPDRYEWEFIPIAGQSFTDSGSAPCVNP